MMILALDVTSLILPRTLMAGSTGNTTPCTWGPSVKFDAIPVGKTSSFQTDLQS